MTGRVLAVWFGLALVPGAVLAHPHIFIDAGLELVFDPAGQATGVRVTWAYDDFYSMLMLQDRELDGDGDGVLTPDEEVSLNGFDMGWDADFEGDTFVLVAGQKIALGRPEAFTASYDAGRVTSTHLRSFAAHLRLGADPLIVQVYDPTYYSAYEITGATTLTGAPEGCSAQVFEADKVAAGVKLQAALDEYKGQDGIEVQFPAVGADYADEMRVTCPAG